MIIIKFPFYVTVDDASGHYTSGYYWGNNYWTGSMSLCRRIYKHDEENDHLHMKRKQSANVGLSFNENAASLQIDHENPPFVPRFAVLKFIFKESHTTPIVRFNLHFNTSEKKSSFSLSHSFQPRTLHLGLCLPSACEKEDVFKIAENARNYDDDDVMVKDIRIPNSDGFSLWKDSTFIVMLYVDELMSF